MENVAPHLTPSTPSFQRFPCFCEELGCLLRLWGRQSAPCLQTTLLLSPTRVIFPLSFVPVLSTCFAFPCSFTYLPESTPSKPLDNDFHLMICFWDIGSKKIYQLKIIRWVITSLKRCSSEWIILSPPVLGMEPRVLHVVVVGKYFITDFIYTPSSFLWHRST